MLLNYLYLLRQNPLESSSHQSSSTDNRSSSFILKPFIIFLLPLSWDKIRDLSPCDGTTLTIEYD